MEEYLSSSGSRFRETPPPMTSGRLTASSLFSQSPSSSPAVVKETTMTYSMPTSSLREEFLEERSRLEKSNFDLKMKVYHLEELVKRLQQEGQKHGIAEEGVRNEVTDLKLQLEERAIELEQRNLLLIKSKSAIEALKNEIEKVKLENARHEDLEERVRRLRQVNDEMELDYKQQLAILDNENEHLRQQVVIKQKELEIVEERTKQVNQSVSQGNDRINAVITEKSRMEDKWIQSQQHIAMLEEELTQCRAHVDLFKIRIEEEKDEKELAKDQLKELSTAKLVGEEKQRTKLLEVTSQFELQLTTMRINHEQELERLRASHAQVLAETKENFQNELGKNKASAERSLQDVKQAETLEIKRIQDDCQSRVAEKAEELRALRVILENERSRSESLSNDLEATRATLRERSTALELRSHETVRLTEELTQLPTVRAELLEKEKKIAELQDAVRRENSERISLTLKLQTSESQLEKCRETLQEKEAELHIVKLETSRLTHVSSELDSKSDTLQSSVRENEKLKILHHRLQTELLEASHTIATLQKDAQRAKEDVDRQVFESQRVLIESDSFKRRVDELRQELQDSQRALQIEKEQRVASESALAELRVTSNALRDETRLLRDQTQSQRDIQSEAQGVSRLLWSAVSASLEAMADWDAMLDAVLCGPPSPNGASNTPWLGRSQGARSGGSALRSFIPTRMSASSGSMKRDFGSSLAQQPLMQQSQNALSPSRFQQQANAQRLDITALECDEVRHALSVALERVGFRVERMLQIRNLFDSGAAKQSEIFENAQALAQEKLSTLQQRVQTIALELSRAQQTTQRDRERREREGVESTRLRETLLTEHGRLVREKEDKIATLLMELEREKHAHEQSQRKVERLTMECDAQKEASTHLQRELRQFEDTDRIVREIDQRVTLLTDRNHLLEKERDALRSAVESTQRELETTERARRDAVADMERLSMQLDLKQELIADLQLKSDRFMREMDRLRDRQIDPQLAMSLYSTQQQLLSNTSAASAAAPVLQQQQQRHESLLMLAEQLQFSEQRMKALVVRSEETVSRFEIIARKFASESIGNNVSSILRMKSAIDELKADVQLLLRENANVLAKILQWISASSVSRLLPSTSSASLSLPTRNSAAAEQEKSYYFPNRQAGIVLEDLMSDWQSPVKDSYRNGTGNVNDMYANDLDKYFNKTVSSLQVDSSRSSKSGAPLSATISQPAMAMSSGLRPASRAGRPRSSSPVRNTNGNDSTNLAAANPSIASMETDELMELLEKHRSGARARTSAAQQQLQSSATLSMQSMGKAGKIDRSLQQLSKKLDAFDLTLKQ